MSAECDPKGICPRCHYQNGPGAQRCVRCRQVLHVSQGCSGACTQCLMQSVKSQVAKKD